MTTFTATYSPDDNKLRLYAGSRLPKDLYDRVKAAGFKWAPKQELFVAPMWTPGRAALMEELAGEIGDEDTSLAERAEIRAGRFDEYSDKRAEESAAAGEAVRKIADGIPFGQAILVGHHSEKRARKDAERIENGMRKAVKLWETAEYWQRRAEGALRHAKYKERPDVRMRRIKKIEADLRKQQRYVSQAEKLLKAWRREDLTREQAIAIANMYDHSYWSSKFEFKRESGEVYHIGPCSLWDALERQDIDLEAVRQKAIQNNEGTIQWCQPWIQHYEFRLAYERAMLAEQNEGKPAPKYEKGGAVRCWASPGRFDGGWSYVQKVNKVSVTVLDNWGNGGKNFPRTIPFDACTAVMSAADVEAARAEGRLIEDPNKRGFFLRAPTPEKEDTVCPDGAACADPECQDERARQGLPVASVDIKAMRETLKTGVQVVAAPQLFPTPLALAERMVDVAQIPDGARVLEPSAGTGQLLKLMLQDRPRTESVAIEVDARLADALRAQQRAGAYPLAYIKCADFLQCNGDLGKFDRIVMNPPFENAVDIKHIQHAIAMLKPGGRLVAICANGPRQRAALMPMMAEWEDLPNGSFKDQGTNVNVAMCVYEAPTP